MRTTKSYSWIINIGIVLAGLIVGHFVQPKSLQKYVGTIIIDTTLIKVEGTHMCCFDDNGEVNEGKRPPFADNVCNSKQDDWSKNVQKFYFSDKSDLHHENQLFIQNMNQHCRISYSKNGYYWMRYLIYLGCIIFLYSIVVALNKLHFVRINRVKDENEKFYSMQMELIRTQLDPHFLFNALNSISYSINNDERKTAYSNLGLFSKFLRESIITLEDFSRSLDEEIDYVKNYLTLEKFRFKEKFDYDFIISPSVNKAQKVPKLILFSFIESALKKSVLPNDKGGRIEVTIDNFEEKGIYILITDIGLHRGIGVSEESHTKNMLMMKRIVCHFNTFNLKKIEIKYKDTGTFENPKGSSVEISIPQEYKYVV